MLALAELQTKNSVTLLQTFDVVGQTTEDSINYHVYISKIGVHSRYVQDYYDT